MAHPSSQLSRLPATLLAVVAPVWFISGCASTPSVSPSPEPSAGARVEPATRPRIAPAAPGFGGRSTAVERVTASARSLIATPYRYGGGDPSGFDCSGFTAFVFDAVGLTLPRTAEAQAGAGSWIPPDELLPGDLLFFGRRREKPLHVGLVVSQPGEALTMIHASTSRGVIETEVASDPYWREHLLFGRRLLPNHDVRAGRMQ